MPETIEIHTDDMIRLSLALNQQLDGIRRGKDILEPFCFAPQIRWNLAKNGVILERAKKTYDAAFRKICTECKVIPGDKLTDANRQGFIELRAKEAEQLALPVKIEGLLFIRLSDLMNEREEMVDDKKVKVRNEIPQSTLIALSPIIQE